MGKVPEGVKTATIEGRDLTSAIQGAAEELGVKRHQIKHTIDMSHFRSASGTSVPRDTVKIIAWVNPDAPEEAPPEAEAAPRRERSDRGDRGDRGDRSSGGGFAGFSGGDTTASSVSGTRDRNVSPSATGSVSFWNETGGGSVAMGGGSVAIGGGAATGGDAGTGGAAATGSTGGTGAGAAITGGEAAGGAAGTGAGAAGGATYTVVGGGAAATGGET